MTTPYIPASDADFDAWIVNFSSLLTAAPTAVGETAPVAAAMQDLADNWVAAYAITQSPSQRTPSAIAAKDNFRVAAEEGARPIAMRINAREATTDEQRTDYGLTVRKVTPTPIPAPTTFPLLALVGATPLQHQLRYSDSGFPSGKAKPFGATGVEIRRSIGTAAVLDPDVCVYYSTVTKSPFRTSFNSADRGKVCTYFARFVTRSGPGGIAQTGPWSAALDVNVI